MGEGIGEVLPASRADGFSVRAKNGTVHFG